MKETKQKFWMGALLLLLLLAAARTASVVLSFLVTDIRYAETLWPVLVNGAKQALSVAAFGAGICLLAGLAREAKRMLWRGVSVASALFFLDAAVSFAIDAVSGAVTKELLPVAALYCGINWLFHTVLLLFVALAANRSRCKGRGATRTLLSGALVYTVGRLFLETVYLVQFLIEVDFQPYASEVGSILLAYGDILLLYGGGGFLSAFLLFRWIFPQKGRNT